MNLASQVEHAAGKRELIAWLPKKDAPDAPRSRDDRFDPATVRWLPKDAG